jgi:hypothetical protein
MKSNISIALLSALLATAALSAAEAPAPEAAIPYTRATCLVSGEALGEMGAPITYIHKEEGKPDRIVKFCCKTCVSKFKKAPAKYLAKLDQAAKPDAEKPETPAADAHAGHAH